jgi:hypothetical protein
MFRFLGRMTLSTFVILLPRHAGPRTKPQRDQFGPHQGVSPIYTFDQDRDATTDNEQRPNWAPGVTSTTPVSPTQLFDPNVFVLPPVGSRGNVGRNVIDGPSLVTFDPAFVKSFAFGASKRSGQLRIEVFNAFNRVNFAIPSIANLTVFNSPTERNDTAGQITSTSTPARQVQLALRFLF